MLVKDTMVLVIGAGAGCLSINSSVPTAQFSWVDGLGTETVIVDPVASANRWFLRGRGRGTAVYPATRCTVAG